MSKEQDFYMSKEFKKGQKKKYKKILKIFTKKMLEKWIEKQENGYAGWDQEQCRHTLVLKLESNLKSHKWINVANLILMVWNLNNEKLKDVTRFRKYKRSNIAEIRPYKKDESLENISVSDTDDPKNDMGYIGRNPKNHNDQWYIAKKYFKENFIEVKK